jgi:hypothetical protein
MIFLTALYGQKKAMRLTTFFFTLLSQMRTSTKFCIRNEIANALELEEANQLFSNKARLVLWLLEVIIRCIRNSI